VRRAWGFVIPVHCSPSWGAWLPIIDLLPRSMTLPIDFTSPLRDECQRLT
jgi:hypothetical protein